MAPRWPQDGPKMAPRWPQDGPKMAPDSPKMAFKIIKNPTEINKLAYPVHVDSKMAQEAPRWPKMAPRRPQDGPKMAQDGPKMAPRLLQD